MAVCVVLLNASVFYLVPFACPMLCLLPKGLKPGSAAPGNKALAYLEHGELVCSDCRGLVRVWGPNAVCADF